METRANYALIGAFTLCVIAAAFGFVFWFTGGGQARQRVTVDIVFSGSVSGLSIGSSVMFNGIAVGQVVGIRLRPEDTRQVDVRVQVDRTTPLRKDTRARLELQGLTGAAAISMTGGDPRSPELVAAEGDDYPEIFADRSDFQDLLETARNIAGRANDVLTRIDKVVGENQASFTEIVHNIETFSKALGNNSAGVERFLRQIGDSGQSALDEVREAATSIRKLSENVDTRLGQISSGLTRFTGPGLQQYQDLAVEGRRTLNDLNRVLRSIERNPQQFIFGGSPPVPQYNGR